LRSHGAGAEHSSFFHGNHSGVIILNECSFSKLERTHPLVRVREYPARQLDLQIDYQIRRQRCLRTVTQGQLHPELSPPPGP
jgi:hypothetical protein